MRSHSGSPSSSLRSSLEKVQLLLGTVDRQVSACHLDFITEIELFYIRYGCQPADHEFGLVTAAAPLYGCGLQVHFLGVQGFDLFGWIWIGSLGINEEYYGTLTCLINYVAEILFYCTSWLV